MQIEIFGEEPLDCHVIRKMLKVGDSSRKHSGGLMMAPPEQPPFRKIASCNDTLTHPSKRNSSSSKKQKKS